MARQFTRWSLSPKHRWFAGLLAVGLPAIALTVQQVHCSKAETTGTDGPQASAGATMNARLAEKARRVQVVQAGYANTGVETTYPGTVRAAETAALAFRVGGPLVEVAVKPGDAVRKGDVLLRIDPRDFENAVQAAASALDSARAKLSAMKAGARREDILALEARMDSAVAKRKYLQAMYERNERLVATNAVSRATFDASESELAAIQAEIEALEQELEKAKTGARTEDIDAMEADIRGMESSLKSEHDRLADATLRAPFNGIVARRMVENHEHVSAGKTVLVVHDIAQLKIDVALPDKELMHRTMDAPFRVAVRFVAAPDRTFDAILKEISTEADPATRTYLATFVMPSPPDLNILPGMIADVVLQSQSKESRPGQALRIPASALQSGQGGTRFVWMVANGAVRQKPVVVGNLSASNEYQVITGIAPGDRIVAGGAAFLHEGAQVEVHSTAGAEQHQQVMQAGLPASTH